VLREIFKVRGSCWSCSSTRESQPTDDRRDMCLLRFPSFQLHHWLILPLESIGSWRDVSKISGVETNSSYCIPESRAGCNSPVQLVAGLSELSTSPRLLPCGPLDCSIRQRGVGPRTNLARLSPKALSYTYFCDWQWRASQARVLWETPEEKMHGRTDW